VGRWTTDPAASLETLPLLAWVNCTLIMSLFFLRGSKLLQSPTAEAHAVRVSREPRRSLNGKSGSFSDLELGGGRDGKQCSDH
jgi:hypothetical protein